MIILINCIIQYILYLLHVLCLIKSLQMQFHYIAFHHHTIKTKVNHFCKCTQSPISMLSMQLPSNQISIFGRSDGWLKETEILSDARVKWFPGGELKYSSNYIAHYVHNLSSRFKFRLTVEYMVQNKGCWVK